MIHYVINSDNFRSFPDYTIVTFVQLPEPEEREYYEGDAPQYSVDCPENRQEEFEKFLTDNNLDFFTEEYERL